MATAEDLVQLAEDLALQISTSFFHLWNIYGVDDVDDVDDNDDDNDDGLQVDMVMLPTPATECPDSSSLIPFVRI